MVRIASLEISKTSPVFLIAEIGINHNGSIELAKKLIDVAKLAGFSAVKFQKRTPDLCVPAHERDKVRTTPWGEMTYIEYKHRIEFDEVEFNEINQFCADRDIIWFASPWDVPSVDFLEKYDVPCLKIASACVTDHTLLKRVKETGRPVIMSTGMSTVEEIDNAVAILGIDNLVLLHCTSTYPCVPEELNLKMLNSLEERYGVPVGYSGHEVGLQTTFAATALGARVIERHVTLDRNMWGTDQSASVEPTGQFRMVRDIRIIERALGDGTKIVYDSEKPIRDKLRRV